MSEAQYLLKAEHDEFARRLDAENHRQNQRLEVLEENVKKIGDLTLSIKDLTGEIKTMSGQISLQGESIAKQNDRLEKMEKKPIDSLNTIKMSILSGLGGAIASGIIAAIIFLAANAH